MAESLSEEQRAEFQHIFNLIDKDKDGKICGKEIETFMKAIGKKPTASELKRIMDTVDTDKKGSVSFQEFITMLSLQSEDSSDDYREVFAVFDKNKDGFITHSELRDVFKRLGENLTNEEIDEMMSEADIDRDGRLSYQDFVGLMKSM